MEIYTRGVLKNGEGSVTTTAEMSGDDNGCMFI
jgi:hypothetical protein